MKNDLNILSYENTKQLIEKVNPRACNYILSLSQGDFFKIFPKNKTKKQQDFLFGRAYFNNVMNILKNIQKNEYQQTVQYETSKTHSTGRLYAKNSLQSFEKDLRSLLTEGIYHDYDMQNAFPSILLHVCKSKGIQTIYLEKYCRDRAMFLEQNDMTKCDFLTYMNQDRPYGLSKYNNKNVKILFDEINKAKKILFTKYKDVYSPKEGTKNPISSCVSNLLCDIENSILHTALNKVDKTKVGVLMFDGFMTEEKLDVGVLNCKYMTWTEKQNISRVKIPDDFAASSLNLEEKRYDVYHYEIFNMLFKGKCFDTKSGLYMYDDDTGVWSSEQKIHMRIIYNKKELIFTHKAATDLTFNKVFTPLYKIICSLTPQLDNFMDHKLDIGFLCFKNGVLDMKTKDLLPFDPKYRFTTRIDRDYKSCNEGLKDEIMERLFKKQFTDHEKMEYMLEKLSRGFAGASSLIDKQFMYLIGDTNCGKGCLTKLFQTAFGSYVDTFNANNLLVTNGNSGDDEKDNKWIIPFCDKRMAISNEIQMKAETSDTKFGKKKGIVGINAEILKMLVSKGDEIKARLLSQNAITVVNKANICICVNDIPVVTPVSDAYLTRANYIEFDRTSCKKAKLDDAHVFVADNTIVDFCQDIDTADAFVDLMCDYFKRSEEHGLAEQPGSVKHKTREYSGVENSDLQWVRDRYLIHENPGSFQRRDGSLDWDMADGWYIQFNTLHGFFLESGNTMSKTRFGRELKKIGVLQGVKWISGSAKKVIVGIQPRGRGGGSVGLDDSVC